jgi:hypothetical protein
MASSDAIMRAHGLSGPAGWAGAAVDGPMLRAAGDELGSFTRSGLGRFAARRGFVTHSSHASIRCLCA